ncbi:MAG: hypothetical protein ACON4Z_16750 [Planctomycetota bacterium]
MGKILRCRDCGKVYRDVEELEDLRDNDSACLVCNNTIEVADWDRVLASYEEDEEGDVDEDDWDDDEDALDDADEADDDDVSDDDFEDLEDEDEDDEDEDED